MIRSRSSFSTKCGAYLRGIERLFLLFFSRQFSTCGAYLRGIERQLAQLLTTAPPRGAEPTYEGLKACFLHELVSYITECGAYLRGIERSAVKQFR